MNNNLIKAVMVGGALWATLELGGMIGRGQAIGIMSKHGDEFASESIKLLKDCKGIRSGFIRIIAESYKDEV